MQLLKNRVLVKLLNDEVVSGGGIIIPKTVQTLGHVKAEVVLTGEKSMYGEWWMQPGDTVKMDAPNYAKQHMSEIEYEGKACLIVNENDINYVV